jgi:hypothetical protein
MSASIGIDTGSASKCRPRELQLDNDTAADADGTGIYGDGSSQGVWCIGGALAFAGQTNNNEPASHSMTHLTGFSSLVGTGDTTAPLGTIMPLERIYFETSN